MFSSRKFVTELKPRKVLGGLCAQVVLETEQVGIATVRQLKAREVLGCPSCYRDGPSAYCANRTGIVHVQARGHIFGLNSFSLYINETIPTDNNILAKGASNKQDIMRRSK